jgi:ABC-2 type transport system ATP-binding protein
MSTPYETSATMATVDGPRGSSTQAAIEASGLSKRYGQTLAVDDLTFSISPATIAGFLGPNGAGKTTTFRMLVGLANPTSGRGRILGKAYRDLDDPTSQVGAMLEVSGYHPSRSGRNHLKLLARTAGIPVDRVDELLELVDLASAGRRAVAGYSSGMRQRLGLAAALLGDPDVLLLDEPANGLDPKGIRWLRDFLRSLAHDQNKTVFVSSHILAEVAQMVDEIVIIDRGRLVTQGPIERVVAHMGSAISVRTPDADRLAELLSGREAKVTRSAPDRLLVSEIEIEEVGRLAAGNDVTLFELREEGLSLEETFLALTEGEG